MRFIGYLHGRFYTYIDLALESDQSIQIGDMGVGFPQDYYIKEYFPELDTSKHKFFRGNHDNPAVCWELSHYMGDFGYLLESGIFYCGGGYSIDKAVRTPNIDWWENEELTTAQMNHAIELYEDVKPDIALSHECPTIFKDNMGVEYRYNITSSTESLLQRLFEIHKPSLWVCGHHHIRVTRVISGVTFQCLGSVGSSKLEDVYLDI